MENGETLASRKVVWGDSCTEGSGTAKVGTDEQKIHKRHISVGKQAHHCNALRIQKRKYVDVSVIDRREMLLPGEVLE